MGTPDDEGDDGTDEPETAGAAGRASGGDGELPEDVLDRAAGLTRRARNAVDEAEAAAYRRERDAVLGHHGYAARVREDGDRPVLACYPAEWVEDGTVRVDRVEDVSRGVERPLSGAGDAEDWSAVAERNRALAEAVATAHGEPHGETASALAAFASNHYAKGIERLTADELAEFREEFFPRNAWPSRAQRERLAESIDLVYATAGAERPDARSPD